MSGAIGYGKEVIYRGEAVQIIKEAALSNDVQNIVVYGENPKEYRTFKRVYPAYWIGKPIAGYSTVKCSNCGEFFSENAGRWKYCPECGATIFDIWGNKTK